MNVQRTRLSKEARREQIIRESCKLFAIKGFDLTTTKDIAAAVGVGEALIFHYFPSKDAIFQVLFARWSKLPFRIRPLSIIDGSAIETLRSFVERRWSSDPFNITGEESEDVLIHAAVMKRQNYDSQRAEVISKAPDIVTTSLLPIVVFGQQTGEIREGDPLELASLFFSCVAGVSIQKRDYAQVFHVPSVDLCLDILRKERLAYKPADERNQDFIYQIT